MSKSTVVKLELEAMARDGQALGHHKGKVVFVPYGIPGEVVRARIVEERKRWSRAVLLDVIEPSLQRVDPPCPYFGTCGGCHWQHIGEAQLAYKRQIAVDQLQRLAHIDDPPVLPVLGMEDPWFYRNHVQFAVTEAGQLGFQAARSHDVVPIEQCLLLHPLLDDLHAALDVDWPELRRLSLRAGIHTGEQMAIFETEVDQAPELEVDIPLSCVLRTTDGTYLTLIGRDTYHETLRGRTFRVSAGSFFQVNSAQAEVMLDVVERYLDLEADDVLLDVYCGVGTLGLSMKDRVARVIGIEGHPAAIRDAYANADDVEKVTLIEGRASEIVPQLDERVTVVVVDPPRQGCGEQVIDALARLAPRRIAYVSCNPSTLARDATLLLERGYELREMQPVDFFPQTYHLETVSLWQHTEVP